jgi:hypothetical protein
MCTRLSAHSQNGRLNTSDCSRRTHRDTWLLLAVWDQPCSQLSLTVHAGLVEVLAVHTARAHGVKQRVVGPARSMTQASVGSAGRQPSSGWVARRISTRPTHTQAVPEGRPMFLRAPSRELAQRAITSPVVASVAQVEATHKGDDSPLLRRTTLPWCCLVRLAEPAEARQGDRHRGSGKATPSNPHRLASPPALTHNTPLERVVAVVALACLGAACGRVACLRRA